MYRTAFPEVPPKVEYSLSPRGETLRASFVRWSDGESSIAETQHRAYLTHQPGPYPILVLTNASLALIAIALVWFTERMFGVQLLPV
jgi:hypothetical protein